MHRIKIKLAAILIIFNSICWAKNDRQIEGYADKLKNIKTHSELIRIEKSLSEDINKLQEKNIKIGTKSESQLTDLKLKIQPITDLIKKNKHFDSQNCSVASNQIAVLSGDVKSYATIVALEILNRFCKTNK